MLRAILGGEGIDGAPLQRVLGVVARGDAYLLPVGIHLQRERVIHGVDRRPEKVTVVTHHPVQSIEFQIGLVRVNGHVAATASAAADDATGAHVMMMIGGDGTLEWQTARRGDRSAGDRLLRVALEGKNTGGMFHSGKACWRLTCRMDIAKKLLRDAGYLQFFFFC